MGSFGMWPAALPLTKHYQFSYKFQKERAKFSLTCHEGTDLEYSYSSTLSLTLALDGSGRLNAMSRPLYTRE